MPRRGRDDGDDGDDGGGGFDVSLGFDVNLRRRREVDRGGRHTHLPSEFQLFVGSRAVRGGGGGVSERGSRGPPPAAAAMRRRNAVVRGEFLSLVGALGPTRTWCAYLVVCVAAWFAVSAVLPETRRSLESMGEEEERDDRGRVTFRE